MGRFPFIRSLNRFRACCPSPGGTWSQLRGDFRHSTVPSRRCLVRHKHWREGLLQRAAPSVTCSQDPGSHSPWEMSHWATGHGVTASRAHKLGPTLLLGASSSNGPERPVILPSWKGAWGADLCTRHEDASERGWTPENLGPCGRPVVTAAVPPRSESVPQAHPVRYHKHTEGPGTGPPGGVICPA